MNSNLNFQALNCIEVTMKSLKYMTQIDSSPLRISINFDCISSCNYNCLGSLLLSPWTKLQLV